MITCSLLAFPYNLLPSEFTDDLVLITNSMFYRFVNQVETTSNDHYR
jgi:hypothetical protein